MDTHSDIVVDESRTDAPRVFMVAVENVMPLWPLWEPLLIRALRNLDTHNATDVRRAVLGEQAHLWVQWDASVQQMPVQPGPLQAFIVTEFAVYPRGTWLRLWLAGAMPGTPMDDNAFEDALAVWRDAHNCRGYEVVGRMGWLRRFPEARFQGAVMRTTT
jgi:hypothetical protein